MLLNIRLCDLPAGSILFVGYAAGAASLFQFGYCAAGSGPRPARAALPTS
jgi:hypothetical protein